MPKSIIAEGKTTNEAIENGLKKLKVSKNQVTIKILENDEKRSFFSILAPRVVKVELTIIEKNSQNEKEQKVDENENKINTKKEQKECTKEELETAEKNVKNFLDEFLSKIGKDIEYEINSDNNGLIINITGENAGFLIGYRGDTLYSMQNILSSIASKGLEQRIRIILDICGYKAKREKTLEELAERIARTVIRTKKPVTLEPMKAYERKIIHNKLQSSKKVETVSIGEEPRRRVVIKLK